MPTRTVWMSLAVAIALALAAHTTEAQEESAWEALVREDPSLAAAGVTLLERQILQRLTPKQVERFAAGEEQCEGQSFQCGDGFDNDGDGSTDTPEEYPCCFGPCDDSEDSLGIDLPGGPGVPAHLDCWFDGNYNNGDDGCDLHACCMIDGPCPDDLQPELFDPEACEPAQGCVDFCSPITRFDCDCFGCCNICVPGIGCHEVFASRAVSPDPMTPCEVEFLDDPLFCRPCQRNTLCVGPAAILFADGLESGDTSAWSNTVP